VNGNDSVSVNVNMQETEILKTQGMAQRRAMAKAITLLESTRADHRAQADALLTALLPHTGQSFRLGISGVPGVGKSTFIEALGLHLIAQGHRVAVLAVDPSSSISGGSILGDKTRMEQLSVQTQAFIRPSPARGTLGGVAEHTREAMIVLEAAGYDVVIVETVGVGQSEVAVSGMTDLFVLMQLPNAGDDLQAIKRGVMELADMVLINKADIDSAAATRAQAQMVSSVRIMDMHGMYKDDSQHEVMERVLLLSALKGQGVHEFWQAAQRWLVKQRDQGLLESRRHRQAAQWMQEKIDSGLRQRFETHPAVKASFAQTQREVTQGKLPPTVAARRLLEASLS
jgi:LAO/AO transport system kinase